MIIPLDCCENPLLKPYFFKCAVEEADFHCQITSTHGLLQMCTHIGPNIDWGRLLTESIHLVPINVIFRMPSNVTAVTVCVFSYLDPCVCLSVFQPLISRLVSRITSSSRTCSSMRTHQWVSVSFYTYCLNLVFLFLDFSP